MCNLKKVYSIIIGSLLLIGSSIVVAATNPVAYSLTPSTGFPTTITVGNTYVVRYTFTNQLPFNLTISNVSRALTGASFSVSDACSGHTLAGGASCPVTITSRPTHTGVASMQLTLYYDKNVVPLPTLSSTVQSGDTTEISGAVSEPLPTEANVGTGYPVTFRFTNIGNSAITASAVTLTGNTGSFVQTQNNCTSTINPSNYCAVSGTFTPVIAGSTSIGATYSYNGNTQSVPLSTQTFATNTGSCASVTGSIPLELPAQTYSYGDNAVEFQFTNHCSTASAVLGTISLSAPNTSNATLQSKHKRHQLGASNDSSILTKGNDTCSGQTLAANGSCTVYAALVPGSTTGATQIEAKVNYTESSQSKTAVATTTSTINANNTTARMITVVNQCSVPVWMTFNAGAYGSQSGCTTNPSLCPSGTTCNTSAAAGAGLCYWSNPTQGVNQDGKLLAAVPNQPPSTMNITIPETSIGNVIYNAGIMPRLGCSGTGTGISCKINACTAGSDGMCLPGDGPSTTPVAFNAVEFTFNQTNGDGVYNNQIIDGVTVPMEMKGRGSSSTGAAPYDNCSSTGAIIQPSTGSATTQLGSCSFSFSPPNDATNYRYVYLSNPSSPTYCDTNSDCSVSGEVCGLAYDSGNKIDKACGLLEGYTSVNKGVCSQGKSNFGRSKSMTSPTFGTYIYDTVFSCDTSYGAYTNTNLYACNGSLSNSSCYNSASPCCGCADWWTSAGGSLTVPTSTVVCPTTNSNWNTAAQPNVQWVKSACPTSYAYQYDDKSSSFTCSVMNGSNVVTNYQVTFCPGGKETSTITS